MTILFRILMNLLFGAAEIAALECITRGIAYVHQKTQAGIIPAWQVWIFVVAAVVVLVIRRLQPLTWLMDKVRDQWRFHLVTVLAWASISSSYFHWGIPLGLDLKGGSELLYRVRYESLPPEERAGVTARTVSILERRLNPQGTRELRIQQQGAHRILIQLPGADVAETQRDKDRIQRAGRLEFRLVDTDPNHIDAAKQGKRVAGVTPYVKGEKDRYYKASFADLKGKGLIFRGEPGAGENANARLIINRAHFTGKELASAYPTREDVTPAVGFQFTGGAKRRFARFTEQNVHKHMAIVLDDVMYSDPVIKERIFGAGRISGSFTQEEVNNLVVVLRAGSLPADVELEMENHVGPTLGEDSIRKSIMATIIAMAIVLGFMAIYYLAAGCVADFALMLNLLLVLGAMSTLSATLTLPGIAGLILTVGMSVDANVLIYERIREEKERILRRRGKEGPTGSSPDEEKEIIRGSLRDIIRKGYDMAFSAIIDSNITTLITSVILYLVGTGPIKGFAVTLSFGILTSMFTALCVTRWIFEYAREHGWLTDFKMNSIIGRTNISFTAVRLVMFVMSLAAIVVGMTFFVQRGTKKYDIDFTGGTRLLLQLSKPMPIDEARKRVAEAGYPRAEVQSLWSPGTTEATGTDQFNIRIPAGLLDVERTEAVFREDISAFCGKENVEKIAFTPPLAWDVALKAPMGEAQVRAGLVARGYAESIIQEVSLSDVKSSKFIIEINPALSEAEQKTARKAVTDRLKELLLSREVKYVIGRLRAASEDEEGEKEPDVQQLEINLDRTVATEMIEQEMKKQGFDNITAVARGGLRGSGVAKRAYLRGSEATLKKIREKGEGKFEVVSLNFSEEGGGIEMELKEAMTEDALRARLGPAAAPLQSIVAPDATGKDFHIVLAEVGETKVRKHIGDDLTKAFADCVALEKIGIKFEPTPQPTDLTEEEKEEAARFAFVTMKLDQAQPLSVVKDRLMKAGALSCLIEKEGDATEEGGVSQVALKIPKDEAESRQKLIAEAFEVPDPFKLVVGIGGTVAGEMKDRAFLAIVFAMAAIIIYIWFRFGELKFGIAAVVALVHDVAITIGALAIGDMIGDTVVGRALLLGDLKISLPVVAAVLTVIGYSLNDTIVIFDRIRENLAQRHMAVVDAEVIDVSVNQTLSRTLLTSLTTLVVVVSLYLLGGSVIHGFAFSLIIGVVVGTYSSIFIASPLLIEWDRFRKRTK
ncbi:MAG: protein translocase subunit SecD [Planctomycetota bacterium]